MANSNALKDIFISGAAGLGSIFADKDNREPIFKTVQGVLTPRQTPINPSAFSFDFSGAFKKLLAPNPKQTAQLELGRQAESILKTGIQAGGNFITSKIEDIFRTQNKDKREETIQSQQPATIPAQALPSQITSNINDVFNSFLQGVAFASEKNSIDEVSPTEKFEQAAADNATRNVLLVSGAGLLFVLLLTQKGKR